MKKKIGFIIITILLLIMCSGCSTTKTEFENENSRQEERTTPKLDAVKNIGKLATLKCYYHNVAKSVKKAGTGLSHVGEKDRKFWIEYTGIVEISFNTDEIRMVQSGENMTIALPEPEIKCSIDKDSWGEDSYIVESDHKVFQKNPITAEDQMEAIDVAQEDMRKTVKDNSSLVGTAKAQAKLLITNYINQIGEATNTKYNISWEDNDNISSEEK